MSPQSRGIARYWRPRRVLYCWCGLLLLSPVAAGSAASTSLGGGDGEQLARVSLRDVDPLAVCNDGSPAAYYWKPATTNSTTWIVDLEGGGWCHDAESCRARCQTGKVEHLCSSKLYPPVMTQGGLFAPAHNPALDGAHKVWVRYCSSDAHMGDAEALGYHFRGARVVRAVFRDLVLRRGLGRGPGKQLLILGGQSAGSRGAMVHLDYVQEYLLEDGVRPGRVRVVGLLDSPLWIHMDAFPGVPFQGFEEQCKDVYGHANVGLLGRDCATEYRGSDAWKCIMGQYRMPYVRTPYLLIASQFDSFQLEKIMGMVPKTEAQKAWSMEFARRTAVLVKSLRSAWPRNATMNNAVFSWACYNHATTLGSRGFDKETCRGATIDAAMEQFLGLAPKSRTVPDEEWVDDCAGFACGAGCLRDAASEVGGAGPRACGGGGACGDSVLVV